MVEIDNTLPIVGKTYNYFDDGKIKHSRCLKATITSFIPFSEIDSKTLSDWREEIADCPWLYADNTDYFIFAELNLTPENNQEIVFVKTVDNTWFSMGWWAGRLDLDNSLTNKLDGIL